MEIESEKTLESRLAQIEEWKRCKEDAEYRAKVKAENEYWDAVLDLKPFHKRIEEICTLADKLRSYKVYYPNNGKLCLVSLYPNVNKHGYKEYFGVVIKDSYGVNTDHFVLYDNGEFYYCYHSDYFNPSTRYRPDTKTLKEIYDNFPEFEKSFYKWFDEAIKI